FLTNPCLLACFACFGFSTNDQFGFCAFLFELRSFTTIAGRNGIETRNHNLKLLLLEIVHHAVSNRCNITINIICFSWKPRFLLRAIKALGEPEREPKKGEEQYESIASLLSSCFHCLVRDCLFHFILLCILAVQHNGNIT